MHTRRHEHFVSATHFLRVSLALLATSAVFGWQISDSVAGEADISKLIRRLSDRRPTVLTDTCAEIGSLAEQGRAAGGALVELMIREPQNSPVWRSAADALQQVSPAACPHILTILLNDDRQAAQRLAAARALIDVGATNGAASLPALTFLWQQPTNNYKQATLLQALHAVAPQDKTVSRLILQAARGDLDNVLLGSHCRAIAVELIVLRDLPEDDINQALVAALRHAAGYGRALSLLADRAKSGKANPAIFAEVCLALLRKDAALNRTNGGACNMLIDIGPSAKGILPGLQELKYHPSPEIRADIGRVIEAIGHSLAVATPDSDELWEVTGRLKNGRYTIRLGDRQDSFSPRYDRTAVFDAAGGRLAVEDNSVVKTGTRLRIQYESGKIIAVWVVE